MAYQAFYNKYRPQTFDEVVGQKAIVTTLKNAIQENKIGHAYLFCGPRGTGKTTMARLFAKALNCEDGLGKQCNECQSCSLIMKGEHPDVFELDAASNSSVEDIRHIVENVSYQPIMSRYKVYIIDEVHSISKDAFNALLKTLEEPPSFVVFILATTEPQQILPTILSRVQRFDFSKVSEADLIRNMERVLNNEHISYEPEALKLITSLSDGGVRDSLSLLEKAVSYCGNDVKAEDVTDLLGLLSTTDEIRFIQMISEKKTEEALSFIKEKYEKGADIRRLHKDLIAIYKDFLIYQATRNTSLLTKLNEKEVKSLHLNPYKARNDIDYLITSFRSYRLTEDVFSEFELTLLRLTSEIVPEPAPTAQPKPEAKKEEETTKENQFASTPVDVKSSTGKSGFAIEAKKEEVNPEETIVCSKEELVNLMRLALKENTKDKRKKYATEWPRLQDLFVTDLSFGAKALSNADLRLVASDILIVTSNSAVEAKKLSKKSLQPSLLEITKKTFGDKLKVVIVDLNDFKECADEFKQNPRAETHPCQIDFGKLETITASTQFFDELMKPEEK